MLILIAHSIDLDLLYKTASAVFSIFFVEKKLWASEKKFFFSLFFFRGQKKFPYGSFDAARRADSEYITF